MSFDPNRGHRFFLRWLISAACIVSALLLICGGSAHAKDDLMIEDLAVSPDGRIVAFQFSPAPDGLHGLGLYDWRAGTVTRIPNPDGKQLGVPRFSYDGKKLVVVIGERNHRVDTDIAIIDLSTLETTQITHDHPEILGGRTSPVFQPGTDNILYVYGGIGIYSQLKLLNTKTGEEKTILDKNNGFVLQIFTPYFVGSDEIYFQAISPVDPTLRKEVNNLTGGDTYGASSTVSYHLRLGEQPAVLFPEIERHRNGINGHMHYDLTSLTVSEGARAIYFVDGTNFDKKDRYNYDLFEIEGGAAEKRATYLDAFIGCARVSYDGYFVFFLNDLARQRDVRLRRYELFVFDTKNNNVQNAKLLEKLSNDARFASL